MVVEKVGGANNQAHTELWGTETEMHELENNEEAIAPLVSQRADVVYFDKVNQVVYFLNKETKLFE